MATEDVGVCWPSAPAGRLLLVAVLLAAQLGLVVWFGTLGPAPELGRYPDEGDLAGDYAGHVGERVSLTGRIVETDPVTIRARHADGVLVLRVVGHDGPVAVDESLRVFGVVEPENTIRATDAYAVARSGRSYTRTISFLAGLWVLARILRHWRLDRGEAGLEPRPRAEARTDGGEDA